VVGTDERIRRRRRTFGQADANTRRRRRSRPVDEEHRDAAGIAIDGSTHSLWRAVGY